MVEYCLYESDLEAPDGEGWYTNGNWIDSVDRVRNTISQRSLIKNVKQLLKRNNCSSGCYNVDIIRGPKSIVQDCDFYECCVGYANVFYIYGQNKLIVKKMEIK